MRQLTAMTMAAVALGVFLATDGFGYWQDDNETNRLDDTREWTTMDTGFKVSWLLGRTVWNAEKQDLGSLSELVVAEDGRVTYAILDQGAALGRGLSGRSSVGDEVLAVPWGAVAMDTKKRTLTLDIAMEKLRAAPTFKQGEWERLENPAFDRTVHGYYGVEEGSGEHGDMQGSYKASLFMGKVVRNHQGEELGYIRDMIAGTNGRMKYVIVSQGGGLFGIGSRRLPVPWSAMEFDTEHFTGLLDMDSDMFANAPDIAGSNWRILDNPTWEEKVHKFYGVEASY